jgi:hypothetical protein
MPEIKEVAAQIGPNQICEGFYTLEGDILTMVHPDGKPVEDGAFKHLMKPGDNEEAIAKMLTKKVRAHLRGEIVEGFSRNIEYPAQGQA